MPKLEMRKAKLAITVFFFHSASTGFENSSANRRRIEKQKASQYVAMCYYYPHSPITSIEWQEGCSSPVDLFTLNLGFTDLGVKSITCFCATRPLLSPKQDLIGSYPIHWPKKVQIPQYETHLSRHEHSSKLQNLRNAQEDSKKKKLR